jgi:large subunit ribosomal protein L20
MKPKKAKIFAYVKGFNGRRKNCWTVAIRAAHKAWQYAYKGRKMKKRDFRSHWIQQINAATRQHGQSYSEFMKFLPLTGLILNRKVLANLAVSEPMTFQSIVEATKIAKVSSQGSQELR